MYQVLGTEAAQRGMRLSIAAQTSNAYFLLRSLDLQLSTAERTVKTRTDALRIYTARYEQGLISELDLSRAKTEVETAKTALYQTRISRDAAESALEALLGRSPKDIMDGTVQRGMTLESIPTPPVIPAGVPSDLLERRPDIQQAEMAVKSANANIGVAKAAWFPAISLTGLFGVVSPELHTLMSNPLQTWSYGGAASLPLLDFGRVKYGVEAAEAKQRESLATYEKTVQGAFKEMRDALTRQQDEQCRRLAGTHGQGVAAFRGAGEYALRQRLFFVPGSAGRGTLVVRQRNAARRRAQRTPVVHRQCLPRAWRRLEVA